MAESPAPRPWLVFADDWGRHPSSCQHLVRALLPGQSVTWVNTIGTRPPRLDWGTAKRAAGKLKGWLGGSAPTPHGSRLATPTVVAPKMWPSFRSRFGRSLNRKLLLRALRPVVEAMPAPPVIITTLPLVADLVGELPAAKWVYYCVDDFSIWPGYDGATMAAMERELLPKIDVAIAVSETLVTKLASMGKPAHLLTHGVDLPFWQAPKEAPPEFAGIERPIVLFWGVIDRRMDTAFVERLGRSMTAGTIVLVGPQEAPDPALLKLPRVVVRPPVKFERLPALAAAASVLVMPYIDAPVTQAMQPLKLKEYLATGRPCVVRDLGTTRVWADALDIAVTPEQFSAAVLARLAGDTPLSQLEARKRLASESWAAKAEQFRAWIDAGSLAVPAHAP